MIIAMLLAHLVGDYILQWDALARRKALSIRASICHGSIVLAATLLFAVLINPAWWPWALFIGLAHTLIDAGWVRLNRRFASSIGLYGLVRLLTDQALHVVTIALALIASGYLLPSKLLTAMAQDVEAHRMWAVALGYVFISLPAWIFIEFVLYGLIDGSAPDFARVRQYKYVGSLERGLIATFVATGQFMLVPVVALPRLILEGPQYRDNNRTMLYLAEWLGSLTLAVLIGLVLGRL